MGYMKSIYQESQDNAQGVETEKSGPTGITTSVPMKKIEVNQIYKSRSGCIVEIYAFKEGQKWPFMGAYKDSIRWNSGCWQMDGSFQDASIPGPLDICVGRSEV